MNRRRWVAGCVVAWVMAIALGGTLRVADGGELTVGGLVRDESGAVVAGALVTVEEVDEARELGGATLLVRTPSPLLGMTTRTDEQGRYRFSVPSARTRLRVSVLSDGFDPGQAQLAEDSTAETRLRVALPRRSDPQVIRIRIEDRSGRPVAGAFLRVDAVYDLRDRTAPGSPDLVDQTAVSDTDGEIRLRSVVPQLGVSAWVSKAGLATELFSAYTPGVSGRENAEESDGYGVYTLVVLRPGEPIRGTLTDGSRPIAGAVVEVVRVTSNPRHFDLVRVVSGDDGTFDFPPLLAHSGVRMYGRMGQPGASASRSMITGLEDAQSYGFGLLIAVNHRLAGQLRVAGESQPVAGARVRLERAGGWDHLETTSDEQGRFAFEGVPSDTPLRLRVRSEGLALAGQHPNFDVLHDALTGRITADLTDLTIPLVRGRRPPLSDLPRPLLMELRQNSDLLEAQSLAPPSSPATP